MAYYRCYFLSRDNSFTAVNPVYSDTDSDAIVQASMLTAESPQAAGFELWQGARQVCKHMSSSARHAPPRVATIEPPAAVDCTQATARLLSARAVARGIAPLTLSEARRIRAAATTQAATQTARRNY